MALPQATKTDYGNADDITPLEMNNVGKNLEALDQDYRYYAGSTGNAVGGDANNVVLTSDPASKPYLAYQDGQRAAFRPAGTNTAGLTIAQDGLAAKAALKREGGAKGPLVAGDVVFNVETLFVFSTQSDAWILESNPNVAVVNAPNTHSANISQKNPSSIVQRRRLIDTRPGNEDQYWDTVNAFLDGAGIWRFDDDTKAAFGQRYNLSGGGANLGSIEYYHALPNPGGIPSLSRVLMFSGGIVDTQYGAGRIMATQFPNVCTTDQTIKKDQARLIIDANSLSPGVVLKRGGFTASQIVANALDDLSFRDSSGATQFSFNTASKKMTVGRVPMDRAGFRATITSTVSLAPGQFEDLSVIHGLGTDEVKVLVTIIGAVDSNLTRYSYIRPDGYGAGETTFPPVPPSGQIKLRLKSIIVGGGSTQIVAAKIVVLQEV